jgi:hypothetical protein
MANPGKHPPTFMVGKRVKPPTTKKFGTAVKIAKGPKTMSPGDGTKPATKTMGPYETMAAKAKKEKQAEVAKNRNGIVITPNQDYTRKKKKKEFKA